MKMQAVLEAVRAALDTPTLNPDSPPELLAAAPDLSECAVDPEHPLLVQARQLDGRVRNQVLHRASRDGMRAGMPV